MATLSLGDLLVPNGCAKLRKSAWLIARPNFY
jgi:hypothetical protein